jgi:hypothetical protein
MANLLKCSKIPKNQRVDKNCPHPHFSALCELTPALIPWFKKKVKALETFLLLCFHKIQYNNFTKNLKTS